MKRETPVEKNDFLVETIKVRPASRKKIMLKIVEVGAFAILFGVIACCTTLLLSPFLEERLFPTPSKEIVFTDESTGNRKNEIKPEDMLQEEKVEVVIQREEQEVREELQNNISLLQEKLTLSDIWLVQVTGLSNEISWLESTKLDSNMAAGAIIADNGTELLILVENEYISQSEYIEVVFSDQSTAFATVKGQDQDTGLSVIAVNKSELSEETLLTCIPIEMGSSNSKNLKGNMVIGFGNPSGVNNSISYGFVTSIGTEWYGWDGIYRILSTDIYGNSKVNGFLVNLNNHLIGILDNTNADAKNMVTAIGISELKQKIERMSNGNNIPLFGIKGMEVTKEAHQKQDIPYGAYVTNVKMDSPAMKAGIQPGDIIVKMNEMDVSSMYMFSNSLQQMDIGDQIELVIMRKSQGIYKESKVSVTLAKQ